MLMVSKIIVKDTEHKGDYLESQDKALQDKMVIKSAPTVLVLKDLLRKNSILIRARYLDAGRRKSYKTMNFSK